MKASLAAILQANQCSCSTHETGAVESEAKTLPDVIQETLLTTTSERQGRVIDKDAGGAGMEKKKQEGYF